MNIRVHGGYIANLLPGLVGKGRHEEARAIIIEYHANGDASHPLVNLETSEIEEALKSQSLTSVRQFFDIRVLFNTANRRYRLMCCVAMAWFGQFSGNNIASYYLPIMIANVGITDTSTKLLLNAIYALTGWIFATGGARFHDVFGRRKMLMTSCLGMAACLAIVAGTAAGYEHNHEKHAASRASIAFIFVFGVVFAFSFTSMQPIYPAEVLSSTVFPSTPSKVLANCYQMRCALRAWPSFN